MSRVSSSESIVGAKRVSAVDCRRATAHIDGQSCRLSNLLASGPMLVSHLGMKSYATVAMDRNPDRKRHQRHCQTKLA